MGGWMAMAAVDQRYGLKLNSIHRHYQQQPITRPTIVFPFGLCPAGWEAESRLYWSLGINTVKIK